MDLTHFILLAVERNMISNKFGLEIFYAAFKEAARSADIETGLNNPEADSRFVLINRSFFLAITLLAQSLFAEEDNPFETMY